jgi:hypothetical protein
MSRMRLPAGCALFALLLLVSLLLPPPLHAARMRPYAGIGVLLLPISPTPAQEALGELPLYDQPAMVRLGTLSRTTIPRLEWLLDMAPESVPVVVMARRGEWLRVTYDDAGREGWVRPRWRNAFETWDELFSGRSVRLLPGLRKGYYRLFSRPDGEPLADLTSRQQFRVGTVDSDWVRVTDGRNLAGWLRWRDEDGRMLVGLALGEGASGERQHPLRP